jgi:DNA-binding response OmpR family regulator
MNKRGSLYEISDLNLAEILGRMTDSQVDEYWEALNLFTEKYSELEEKIKSHLTAKDYALFAKNLAELRDKLKDIHADAMAQDCQTQLNGLTSVESIKHEKLEAYMTYLLTTVSILSIDIQKADYENRQNEALISDERASEPRTYKDASAEKQKHILIVDDKTLHLNMLKAYLCEAPYKITCLASGEDALLFLNKNSPDLFVLDIMMPGMDGYKLAKMIRASGHKAPIVFLTASCSKDSVVKAFEAGGADFVVKPVTKEHFVSRIAKFI